MSVDLPSSYPANPASAGKPVDLQTLQETFAAVLRSYGMEKGTSQTGTMLEVLQSASPADNADDRNQQRQDNQQQANRNDFTHLDRKLLDKSDVRHGDLNADYRSRVDRHETLRNEYQTRVERSEQQSASPANVPMSASSIHQPLDGTRPNEQPPSEQHSPQQAIAPITTGANNVILSVGGATPNSATVNGATGLALQMNVNSPTMSVSVTPQVVSPQAFTIFTASGRFGQMQEKPDEKDNEDEKEESVEKKPGKKKQPFAIFEAIHAEVTRPVRRNQPRQLQEAISEKPREMPKENELEQFQNVKAVTSLEEILNTPQNVVSKKMESQQPNQTQYLLRIAAACEAAAQYAPVRIKINLDHLGTLTLRFFFQSDRMALRFETPSKESARFLLNHLDGLKAILSKRNVRLESVEVLQSSLSQDEEDGASCSDVS